MSRCRAAGCHYDDSAICCLSIMWRYCHADADGALPLLQCITEASFPALLSQVRDIRQQMDPRNATFFRVPYALLITTLIFLFKNDKKNQTANFKLVAPTINYLHTELTHTCI
jgi:hypothetical protein